MTNVNQPMSLVASRLRSLGKILLLSSSPVIVVFVGTIIYVTWTPTSKYLWLSFWVNVHKFIEWIINPVTVTAAILLMYICIIAGVAICGSWIRRTIS